jgi:hypothetical protein
MRAGFLLLGGLFWGGCDDGRPPPPRGGAPSASRQPSDPFLDIDANPKGLCGGQVIPLVLDRPNLYFVLDASGSMSNRLDPPIGPVGTLYGGALLSIQQMLRAVGHRVRYGAALFPGGSPTLIEPCPPGREVFSTREGDDVSYALSGEDGPVLQVFLQVLGLRAPSGTTPLAATLRGLHDPLIALEDETYVFLLTDGAPNCNARASCSADTCEPNLTGDCNPPEANCCAASLGPGAMLSCVDSEPTIEAVAKLAADGVKTFVLGLPGSEFFSDVLDALAVAGGTGRSDPPYYYSVAEVGELGRVLTGLGASVAIDCHLELDEAPPKPELVNIYFDGNLVRKGEDAGWRWTDETHIEVLGEDCMHLSSAEVLEVLVDFGCPTFIR